jgi:two-component system CheB/CheR fusion protein
LETSKEELQSINEELSTVNAELQHKVADLLQANNDMNNLLAGTGVGTLFVDFQLRIARFTPTITQIINMIQSDIGRPVGDIVSNLLGYDRMVSDVQNVLDSLIPLETEVQTRAGAWYLMRIRPYRTLENVIEGAVITFIDITQRKQVEAALISSEAKFATAFRASLDGLLISRRSDGIILNVNTSWEQMSGYSRLELLDHSMLELGLFVDPDAWQQIMARMLLQDSLHNHELQIRRKSGETYLAMVSVEQLELESGPGVLTIIRER